MRQFKKFTPEIESSNQISDYPKPQNSVQRPEVYQVIENIDKLLKKDNLAKEYRQEGGQ